MKAKAGAFKEMRNEHRSFEDRQQLPVLKVGILLRLKRKEPSNGIDRTSSFALKIHHIKNIVTQREGCGTVGNENSENSSLPIEQTLLSRGEGGGMSATMTKTQT